MPTPILIGSLDSPRRAEGLHRDDHRDRHTQHPPGRSKHAAALTTRLLGYDADILVITEFRANAAGARLIDRLTEAGYDTSHPDVAPNVNTVLIAARGGIERSWAFDDALDTRHLWCAEIDGAYVCGVYMPQGRAKLPYWPTLIDKPDLPVSNC
ncbi:hypothetical protein [Mycolicibacterium neoaurum]|uniref:hypothetical protein n=1 Tax=Mycolicibacterium neoaurum TaxID=1795 RepID=UPI001F299505|nr:hypothetical protein [Mycolicibacterium neoaurum]